MIKRRRYEFNPKPEVSSPGDIDFPEDRNGSILFHDEIIAEFARIESFACDVAVSKHETKREKDVFLEGVAFALKEFARRINGIT